MHFSSHLSPSVPPLWASYTVPGRRTAQFDNLYTKYKRLQWHASAHLLQTQTDSLGALHGVDELALAQSLFDDVTKVLKVLTEKNKQTKNQKNIKSI